MPAGALLASTYQRLEADLYIPFVQSEYAPSSMERRHFISRFTGSAGTAVITTDAAALWTDGRYFLQVMDAVRSSMSDMKCFYCCVASCDAA